MMTLQTDQAATSEQSMEKVASGQKLFIYSILLEFLAIILQLTSFGGVALVGLLAIIGVIMSLVGMFRIASGLNYSTGVTVVLVILLLVPYVSLITLLAFNQYATKVLRGAGYKVGLLGARS